MYDRFPWLVHLSTVLGHTFDKILRFASCYYALLALLLTDRSLCSQKNYFFVISLEELENLFQFSKCRNRITGGGGRYRETTKKELALTGLISIIQVLSHLMEYRPIVSGLYSLFKFVVFYIHQLLWCFVIKFRLIKCKYVNPSTVDKCQKSIFMQRQAIAILRSNNHPLSNTQ